MPIKHIVFDWDGTLADTIPTLKSAYDATFAVLGLPPMTYDQIKEAAGKYSNRNIFQNVFGENIADEAKEVFYRFIKDNHLRLLSPFAGAEDILRFCRDRKISCHILTNKNRPYLDAEISQLGWNIYFDRILGAGELEHDKPHDDACSALFKNRQPPAEEMLVLGDGAADVAMARFWGCPAVIFDSRRTYTGPAADYTICALPEFINLIESLNHE